MKKLCILGATGNIGKQALNVFEHSKLGEFELETITGGSNIKLLVEQAKKFKPKNVAIADNSLYLELKNALTGLNIEVHSGMDSIVNLAGIKNQLVLSALVGISGLQPTISALMSGNNIAIANKESLVCAGDLINKIAKENSAKIIPVDSEHSALWQLFDFNDIDNIHKITLTASGGPFWNIDIDRMKHIKVEDALKHPTWQMGAKITIDSATMMNKGFEVIEAHHLFPIDISKIEVVVHRQSYVHGAVSYKDGAMLAHCGFPDMRTPISWALYYPNRKSIPIKMPDLVEIGNLTFEKPNNEKFPLLPLAIKAMASGTYATIALNGANEIAVDAFLKGKIGFLDIEKIISETLFKTEITKIDNLDDVTNLDEKSRELASVLVLKNTK